MISLNGPQAIRESGQELRGNLAINLGKNKTAVGDGEAHASEC